MTKQTRARSAWPLVGLAALVLFAVAPLAWAVVASLTPGDLLEGSASLWPERATLANYRALFTERAFWLPIRNSLVVAGATTVLCVSIGAFAAYALARLDMPGKRVILTIRDVYSWCDSWFDHNINIPPDPSSPWTRLDRLRLRVDDFEPTKYDEPLLELGFPPLPCFFQLWARHNETVLAAVPSERLLVVRTSEILDRLGDIAAFTGVPTEALRRERGWLFASSTKHRVLARLDRQYVAETAALMCGPLMEQFFPGVTP